jgi:hypothetical protein
MSTLRRFKKRSKRKGKYKSVLEKKIARILGRKATYETEVLQYLLPKRYTPDFVVDMPGNGRVYIEVKGWFRYEDQAKMRAVKKCNPDLDIRMYFPNDKKVQSSKMTNSEWCKKYEFPYYIGELPKEF